MNVASRTLAAIIEQSNGKFVTCTFRKKDGSIRTLNGRLGVFSALKGGLSTVKQEQYITIYEPTSGGYRSINRDTIVSVSSNGIQAFAR